MKFVLRLCIGTLLCAWANAQTNQGGIGGSVADESGAVLVGATVVALNQDTGVRQQTVTSEGGFRFPSLPVGL